jgi:hypothetical protein
MNQPVRLFITVVATPKPPDDSAEYKRKSILEGRFLLPIENLTNDRSKYISTFVTFKSLTSMSYYFRIRIFCVSVICRDIGLSGSG